jgi:hypothetical protein
MSYFTLRSLAGSILFISTIVWVSSCAKSANPQPTGNPTHPDTTTTPPTNTAPAKKWVISTLAGSGTAGFVDASGTNAAFNDPQCIAIDTSGNLYVGDVRNASIRKVTPDGVVTTIANDAIYSQSLLFGNIYGIAVDQQGDVYDIEYNIVRKTTPTNSILFAGQLLEGYQDGLGTAADFNVIGPLAMDNKGNLFVSDYDTSYHPHLREITPAGQVSTLTLQDNTGYAGTALPNNYYLYSVTVNPQGGFYMTANGNNMIKKVDAQGNVTVFAGSTIGFTDGAGSTALFGTITSLACDTGGNLYVADASNNAIRMVTPAGVVSTIAGNGTAGYLDGDSTQAEFRNPFGVTVDKNGTVYVTDELNYRIRKLVYQ